MLLFIMAYCAGILTILSPCVLPVLPFVFSGAERPFLKYGLPLLLSMALTFSAIGFLGVQGGTWVVQFNHYGRIVALGLLFFFGCTLLFKPLAEVMARPFVALGSRFLSSGFNAKHSGFQQSSWVLGMATGLLWAPCAGPILGLILTGAALQGNPGQTALLLFAYSLGAVSSIALALCAGKKVLQHFKNMLGAGEWIRKGLGVFVILGVLAIATGWDARILSKITVFNTNVLEQRLLSWKRSTEPQHQRTQLSTFPSTATSSLGAISALSGATQWLNTPPAFQIAALKNKVVLVDFWTYSCINCIRSLPYLRAWSEKYKSYGLVVIGVHTPEFAFEKELQNVEQAIKKHHIPYAVAIDNHYAIWQAFQNEYWPAHYFINAHGEISGHHFGEGDYEHSERIIQHLLKEAGQKQVPQSIVTAQELEKATALNGAESSSDQSVVQSPETYLGFERTEHFASGSIQKNMPYDYTITQPLTLNQWGLIGKWIMQAEKSIAQQSHARLRYVFHARDLHLVMGGVNHQPVHFRITIDGKVPGTAHGADSLADGTGVVQEERLYHLIRQSAPIKNHVFEIEFLESNVQVFAFTFG